MPRLDALDFFADKNLNDNSCLLNEAPQSVYWSLKNSTFSSAQSDALFTLGFANDNQLNNFASELGRFKKTRWIFHFLVQMVVFDSSWIKIHLVLVFV
jgi:hypothetical protein